MDFIVESTMKVSTITRSHLRTYCKMDFIIGECLQAWNVNWETRHMMIQFEDDKNVIFQVPFTLHENFLHFLVF